jgi:hypothetical protein
MLQKSDEYNEKLKFKLGKPNFVKCGSLLIVGNQFYRYNKHVVKLVMLL